MPGTTGAASAGRAEAAVTVIISSPLYRPPPVLTAADSKTLTWTLDVEVKAGSTPEEPPPAQVTRQVIVARTVYVPPEALRDATVYV
jgi:hypothetical protein